MRAIHFYEDIPADQPIYIYGAGTAGRTIFARIGAHRKDAVKGFVDSYARGEIDGLPILDPVADRDRLKDAAILIASQAWAEIRHKLLGLGFTNVHNAYPLYAAVANRIPQDDGFGTPALRDALIERIAQSPEGTRFVVVGCNGSAEGLVSALCGSAVSGRIVGHCDIGMFGKEEFLFSIATLFYRYALNGFDRLILAVGPSDFRSVVRRVRTIQSIPTPMWIPKRRLDDLGLPRQIGTPLGPDLVEIGDEMTERHGAPLVVVVPPCAGTMRFLPQIENLLTLLGWTNKPYMPLTNNSYFFSRFRGTKEGVPYADTKAMADSYLKENTDSWYWFARSLRHYEYLTMHDHSINLGRFTDLPFRMVVLMRDPRDIINSYFHRVYLWNESSQSVEDFMLDLLDGGMNYVWPEGGFRWASAREWTDSYIAAVESPNMEVVRFEDLHRDEIGTLRSLLTRLELCPNPFVDITEANLRFAAHLGSFEHQTNGQATRGETRREVIGQTSCRKGVVGDWRSTFTPAVVEKFKRLTGDALIRLGYETSMDWQADLPEPG
ncbi:sulfotransferase domain-containing protein [Azospirillum isscasi]|uniref:Sulfotransferase domain-containing protein n=1 Tax=Azospirillum isscasi TaxID=3053926 RepID=A0ABU0WJ43_9PROT|nr:sulfotransferase domain-containing protein [Azospirillum isscasi]MDQ2104238.1 sulfotransferase domain-containing protein [Azospirillum isscasi]